MRRCIPVLAVFVLAMGLLIAPLGAPLAWAEDPANAPEEPPEPNFSKEKEPVPAIASDEEAAEAIEAFKEAYKARGYKGDEKLGMQNYAMKTLAKVQHRKVVDRLAKLTRSGSKDLRTAAVIYLGEQRAIPGYAGAKILDAIARNGKDYPFVMGAIESIVNLEYRNTEDLLRSLMKHKDYAVQKHTMLAIGEMKDMRLLEDVFKLLKEIKLQKGESWDGVSVTYDTGTAGDGDQKMAEKIGKEKMAKNARKGKRAARAQRDVGPIVEEVLKKLTGEEFATAQLAKDWMKENAQAIKDAQKALDEKAAAQADEARAR